MIKYSEKNPLSKLDEKIWQARFFNKKSTKINKKIKAIPKQDRPNKIQQSALGKTCSWQEIEFSDQQLAKIESVK